MKKIYLLLFAPALLVLACAPKPAPTPTKTTVLDPKPCYTPSKTLVDSAEAVHFTNCSTNAETYLWDFGEGLGTDTTAVSPYYKFTKTRGLPGYHVLLKAFNANQVEKDSSSYVVLGYRQIDSVVVKSAGSWFVSGTDYLFQWGPASNPSMFSAADMVITKFPATFTFPANNTATRIRIDKTNDQSWRGRFFDFKSAGPAKYSFGTASNLFLSRGVNVSPIEFNDGSLDFLVYYSLVTK